MGKIQEDLRHRYYSILYVIQHPLLLHLAGQFEIFLSVVFRYFDFQ